MEKSKAIIRVDTGVSSSSKMENSSLDTTLPIINFKVREKISTELNNTTIKCSIISYNNQDLYYFLEERLDYILKTNKEVSDYDFIIFYDKDKIPLWKIIHKEWNTITLNSIENPNILIHLSTLSPQFKFKFNQLDYSWYLSTLNNDTSYYLKCFQQQTLIAEFKMDQFILFNQNDSMFSSFLYLSGLIINYHIKYLLKSLGNNKEVIQMIISQQNQKYYNHQSQMSIDKEFDQDELYNININNPYFTGHQNLVDNNFNENRWSASAQSFKSIELDPSFWHCYWGNKFWWSWFPCCMPGGCIDRGCVRLKGFKSRPKQISRQGYKQQYY